MIIAILWKKVSAGAVLKSLVYWQDEEARDGPTNMAIDEWLWRRCHQPLLRVYRWHPGWGSMGYFTPHRDVGKDGLWVRRPTGGGVVEHQDDWTYTLMVPRGLPMAEIPGAWSYQWIHEAVALVLKAEGIMARLVNRLSTTASAHCFRHPVLHDLIDGEGNKLAGAGQRRGRWGLLHQGSVRPGCADEAGSRHRGRRLAQGLAEHCHECRLDLNWSEVDDLAQSVYATKAWNEKK